MRAELGLPSVRGDDEKGGGMMGGFGGSMGGVGGGGKAKRPIGVKFEIPYFTTSGIQVRYLKIIEPKVSLLDTARLVFSILTCGSYNTHLCLGYDTLPRAATLLCGCPMFSNRAKTEPHNEFVHGDGVSALSTVSMSALEGIRIARCISYGIIFLEYERFKDNVPAWPDSRRHGRA